MQIRNANESLIVTVNQSTFPGGGRDEQGNPTQWDINSNFKFRGKRIECLIFALKNFDAAYENYSFVVNDYKAFKNGLNAQLPITSLLAIGAPQITQRELDIVADVTNHYRSDLNEQVVLSIQSPVDMDSVPAGELHEFLGTRAEVLSYLLKRNPNNGAQNHEQALYSITKHSSIANVGVVYDRLRDYQAYNEVTTEEVQLVDIFLTKATYTATGRW